MKTKWLGKCICSYMGLTLLLFYMTSCTQSGNKNATQMNNKMNYEKGSYGYDVNFLNENKISTIELKDSGSNACVLLVPGYQGRVMTSSANGNKDLSFGWINYDLIKSGKLATNLTHMAEKNVFG